MARRLKSPLRSRRRRWLGGPRPAVGGDRGEADVAPPSRSGPPEPSARAAAPVPSPAANAPHSPHAPTGWNWFAHWSFPTQFFLFAALTAAGVWWLGLHQRPPSPPPEPSRPAPPRPRSRPRISAETFDWLNRLRETQIVTDQLESEFADAQQFYRDYALDEFLDFDPWTLPIDEVLTLTHFCDHGFFTVEREILLKLLERQLTAIRPATPGVGATARLALAAADRETRLSNLREATDLYRRGRESEVSLPGGLTPEQDQAFRAQLVDKLATVKRERDRLDARIAEAQALLK